MIRHEAMSPDLDSFSSAEVGHQFQIGLVIRVTEEVLVPAVSPLSDAVRQTKSNNAALIRPRQEAAALTLPGQELHTVFLELARPLSRGKHGLMLTAILKSPGLSDKRMPVEKTGSRVEVWRGGLGLAYLLPALSLAGASLASPCSVSTPRSSNRAGRFPAPGFRTRLRKWQFTHVRPRTVVAAFSEAGTGPAPGAGIGQ